VLPILRSIGEPPRVQARNAIMFQYSCLGIAGSGGAIRLSSIGTADDLG
jgi:hypothetical protein